ncbi:ethionine resistance protein [Coemansia sp. BCRC 34962]|nr:ethionine resistance protein [Coemansia sp. BCRC 34962]
MAPTDANQYIESGAILNCSTESTPLLSASPSAAGLDIAKHNAEEPYVSAAKRELKWMASSASVTIFTLMIQTSIMFVNVMSVSNLGTTEVAAMSLSVTCMMVFATAPVAGLTSAMDTFCSTAYTASCDKTLVGFHLQRGVIAVVTHLLIIAPILWNAEYILLFLNQDPAVARLSGTYMRVQIPGILPSSIFEVVRRYLQAQGIMRAGMIIACVVTPIHWLNNLFLVRSPTYGLGFIGAPIVNDISSTLLCAGITTYACNSRAIETWGGWTRSAFRNMSAFYKLAIPSVITTCSELIVFELLIISVSYFGTDQMAGQAIMLNSVLIITRLSIGLGFATSPRIGNLIGASKPRQARIAMHLALIASGIIGTLGTLFLVIFGHWWTSIYTLNPNVALVTARLIPVASVFIVSDGLNAVLGAILRGLGRQRTSMNIFIFGFYVCAVPLGWYLGYGRGMEVVGLWWGLCIGVTTSCLLHILFLFKVLDWDKEVRRCLLRLKPNGSTNSG